MSERKLIFFTSDWHVGHANSLVFDKRPFKDVDHMHRVLINNFNSTVPEDGLTYFLGDVGLCNSDTLKKVISELNGTKVLCLGNHDKAHNAMYNLGFDVVLNAAVLYIAGKRVTMSHCPLLGVYREDVSGMKGTQPGDNWHGERKNQMFSIEDNGQFHLHGHVHSPNHGTPRLLGRQFDVGVSGNNYRPVSISQIESYIAKYQEVK